LSQMQGRPIGPERVVPVLERAKVRYVLVGAHAANGYTGRPRATIDVELVVEFPKKAAKAVAAAFPNLRMQDTPVVTRFFDADHEAIDLMKPTGLKLWRRLLKEIVEIEIAGQPVRVPTLEGVLAAKFAAMVSPGRRLLDKQQDGVDFGRIVKGNARLDAARLTELGDLVYPGGGDEITSSWPTHAPAARSRSDRRVAPCPTPPPSSTMPGRRRGNRSAARLSPSGPLMLSC